MNIIEDLQWRGAINQVTDAEGLARLVEEKKVALYCGVDPTANSMHIGHLIPYMILKRFQDYGHTPFVVIGGATGSIGDPSGRSTERVLQTMDTIHANAEKLTQQMTRLFNTGQEQRFKIVNNYDWISQLSLLDFLRDYGKHFNINTMLAKDVVASRLETGISFTEFSYQILQSIDFHHLFVHHDIQVQIGGGDQWGNITAGLDFIRRMEGPQAEAYGLTVPLLTTADGQKFGKSAGNAIWLDPEITSPYDFYQFWINQQDADVVKLLKYFTFLSREEIQELEAEVANQPHLRVAQKRLAEEVTRFVHGQEALDEAQKITQALFTGDIQALTGDQIRQGLKEMPQLESTGEATNLPVWLVDTGILASRREARELVANGAIRINGQQIKDIDYNISVEDAIDGQYIVVRRGKKHYFLVTLKNPGQ